MMSILNALLPLTRNPVINVRMADEFLDKVRMIRSLPDLGTLLRMMDADNKSAGLHYSVCYQIAMDQMVGLIVQRVAFDTCQQQVESLLDDIQEHFTDVESLAGLVKALDRLEPTNTIRAVRAKAAQMLRNQLMLTSLAARLRPNIFRMSDLEEPF